MEIIKQLIDEKRFGYKCFDELKRLLNNNEYFRKIITEGYMRGKIYVFTEELWDKIISQNIRRIDNFEDVFVDGANLGYCTVCSKQLSYSLPCCYICGGILPILKGTNNCCEGEHTWILYENKIIDTTLMLIIDKSYADKIGYIEMRRDNPNIDLKYSAAKDFTNDRRLKSRRRR